MTTRPPTKKVSISSELYKSLSPARRAIADVMVEAAVLEIHGDEGNVPA
jgi:hypothetical protein